MGLIAASVAAGDGSLVAERDAAPRRRQDVASESTLPHKRPRLRISHRRSQTLPAAMRAEVADPAIAEVVPRPDGDLMLVGLAPGTTELALWRDPRRGPEIWQLTVVPNPAAPAGGKPDVARLERRIRELYPQSRVALVPLSHELLVKGDAPHAEEAAAIIAFLRGSVEPPTAASPSWFDVRLAGGFADDRANAPDGPDVVNQLNVPAERSMRIGVTLIELNRLRLDALDVDLDELFFEAGQGAPAARADATLLARGFEPAELRVLVDWLVDQNAARIAGQSATVISSGHTAQFVVRGADANSTPADRRRAETASRALSVAARPQASGRIALRLEIDCGCAHDTHGLIRATRRFEGKAELLAGHVGAAVVFPDAVGNGDIIDLPLLGELAPATVSPTADGTGGTTDLLIIIAPEVQD